MSALHRNWRALAVVAALGAGFVAVQAVMAQTAVRTPTALNPFSPTITTSVSAITTELGGTGSSSILPVTRPPTRDPFRPPTRSPFRP